MMKNLFTTAFATLFLGVAILMPPAIHASPQGRVHAESDIYDSKLWAELVDGLMKAMAEDGEPVSREMADRILRFQRELNQRRVK